MDTTVFFTIIKTNGFKLKTTKAKKWREKVSHGHLCPLLFAGVNVVLNVSIGVHGFRQKGTRVLPPPQRGKCV